MISLKEDLLSNDSQSFSQNLKFYYSYQIDDMKKHNFSSDEIKSFREEKIKTFNIPKKSARSKSVNLSVKKIENSKNKNSNEIHKQEKEKLGGLKVKFMDLTTKLYYFILKYEKFKKMILLFVIIDFLIRINIYIYIFLLRYNENDFKSLFISFAIAPRILYIFILFKIYFQHRYKDPFIESISNSFNEFDKAFFTNEKLELEFSLSLKPESSELYDRKLINHDFASVFKRIILILTPIELSYIPILFLYKKNRIIFIALMLWFFKSFETPVMVPILLRCYYLETVLYSNQKNWNWNYYTITVLGTGFALAIYIVIIILFAIINISKIKKKILKNFLFDII